MKEILKCPASLYMCLHACWTLQERFHQILILGVILIYIGVPIIMELTVVLPNMGIVMKVFIL